MEKRLSVLQGLIDIAAAEIRNGCTHLDADGIDTIIDTMSHVLNHEKPLFEAEVRKRLGGISRSTLYDRIKKGKFPKGHKVYGENRVVWYKSEIDKARN